MSFQSQSREPVAVLTIVSAGYGQAKLEYFHREAFASVVVITNQVGALAMSHDLFG